MKGILAGYLNVNLLSLVFTGIIYVKKISISNGGVSDLKQHEKRDSHIKKGTTECQQS